MSTDPDELRPDPVPGNPDEQDADETQNPDLIPPPLEEPTA